MVTVAFFLICFLAAGFLTVFFFALCKDSNRHRKCVSVERLIGADYELDLNRSHADLPRTHIVSIEHHRNRNKWKRRSGTEASGIEGMAETKTIHKAAKYLLIVSALLLTFPARSVAQETVFNVPSGDVLDRGKVYSEFDFSYRGQDAFKTFTPRAVVGLGQRFEVGVNINGIVDPGPSQTTVTPTIKWKAYDGGDNGWAFVVGDNLSIPVQNKSYNAGTWTYAEFVKSLKTKTRITAGGFYASRNVFAAAQRGGGQFAVEQTVNNRLTVAADWFTGKHGAGYLTPGMALKLMPKLTWYLAYEIGNTGLSQGNHLLLAEIGWNIN